MVPVPRVEPPTHFHRRREVCGELSLGEPDEACERSGVEHLDRPQAPSVLLEAALDAVDQRVALVRSQWGGKVLHHDRIRVHRRERCAVFGAPLAEQEAIGAQLGRHLVISGLTHPHGAPLADRRQRAREAAIGAELPAVTRRMSRSSGQ